MGLNAYQSIVTDPEDIPVEKLRGLFIELLRLLALQIVQEATPDYCVYEIVKVQP